MKISMMAVNTMLRAINDKFNSISIYEDGFETLTFGVNWGGMGTVTPDEANEFGRKLQEAASLADYLNRVGIERVFEKSEILGENEWTKSFMERIQRKDISASSVVAEFEAAVRMTEGWLL